MATIREEVVLWLMDNPGEFTVTTLAEQLELTRRQTLNALHGLARSGLQHMLVRVGSGVWSYTPPPTSIIEPPAWSDDDPRRPTTQIPVGWVTQIRVVGLYGTQVALAETLTNGDPTGVYLWTKVVDGPIRFLTPPPADSTHETA